MDKLPPDISKFIVMQEKDSDVTDEFLIEYLNRFNKWCDELQQLVKEPTRGQYLLDSVFTDLKECAANTWHAVADQEGGTIAGKFQSTRDCIAPA